MKNNTIVIFSVILIFVFMYVFRHKLSGYDTEIWTKYKLTPVESPELDVLMNTLKSQKKTYDEAKELGEKMRIRVDFEKTRYEIREWYIKKGEELGLDKDAANDFSMDMVMKNSI